MANHRKTDNQELLLDFLQSVEEWEHSPYYLPKEEILDLERFLDDHHAAQLKTELEDIYGTPLNQKFWSSFLSYHRLKRAREEIKSQETLQDEKRRRFLQVMEERKESKEKWAKERLHQKRRQQMKVLPGGKND